MNIFAILLLMKAARILLFSFFTFIKVFSQETLSTDITAPILLHPEQDAFIKNYIQRYGNGLLNLKNNNPELIAFIEYVLAKESIPKELKNLAVIESGLYNKSISVAGAVGPWQFMPETGREFGLRIDSTIDERYDIYKSTFAAAKMLKRLYARYQDWNLVVTAYNCGIGHLDKAIAQSGSRSFGELQYLLPSESRNHVKKFISTTFILDKNILAAPVPVNKKVVADADSVALATKGFSYKDVQAGFRLNKIAEKLRISLSDLKNWNMNFESVAAKKGFSRLVLPFDKMPDFLFYKNEILEASIQQNIEDEK